MLNNIQSEAREYLEATLKGATRNRISDMKRYVVPSEIIPSCQQTVQLYCPNPEPFDSAVLFLDGIVRFWVVRSENGWRFAGGFEIYLLDKHFDSLTLAERKICFASQEFQGWLFA